MLTLNERLTSVKLLVISQVGDEEIERSYGGAEYPRGYYSSIYSR
jgi:hypothetical protein